MGKGKAGPAAGLSVVAVVGIALLVKGLHPVDLPVSRNPDFIDNVFANRAVLWAARMLLVSAAGVLALGGMFIAASIGIRRKNGEWLRRAGPFEISEASSRRQRPKSTSGGRRRWRAKKRSLPSGSNSRAPTN